MSHHWSWILGFKFDSHSFKFVGKCVCGSFFWIYCLAPLGTSMKFAQQFLYNNRELLIFCLECALLNRALKRA